MLRNQIEIITIANVSRKMMNVAGKSCWEQVFVNTELCVGKHSTEKNLI